MLTSSSSLCLRTLIVLESMHGGRPYYHGCKESVVVQHFGLRVAPPAIKLVTLEAGWLWSRCGLWRYSLL
ncbi:hypothetical protein LINPERPRIM_LOCUS22697 [Linum perenne]